MKSNKICIKHTNKRFFATCRDNLTEEVLIEPNQGKNLGFYNYHNQEIYFKLVNKT